MQRKVLLVMAILALALGLSLANVGVANSADATGSVGVTAYRTPLIAGTNLISDAGFEGNGQGSWITDNWDGPWSNNYDVTDYKYSGSQSLKQVANGTNVSTNWEKAEAKQIFPIQPGDMINGGAWLKWENLSNIEAYIECKWLDANQQELKSVPWGYVVGLGTTHKTSGSADWEYQDLIVWKVTERTAPPGAAYVDFRLVFLSAGEADVAAGTIWWDDAQFEILSK